MPRPVDAITPTRRRAPARPAKTVKPKPAASTKGPAPVTKLATSKSKRTPAEKRGAPRRTTPAPAPAPTVKPSGAKAAPQFQEHRRRLLVPLVAGSFVLILILWAGFGAAMHPRASGDSFVSSFVRNLNWSSIRAGWDTVIHRDTAEERAIRKAEKEIFPQFETSITTK